MKKESRLGSLAQTLDTSEQYSYDPLPGFPASETTDFYWTDFYWTLAVCLALSTSPQVLLVGSGRAADIFGVA